MNGKLFVFEGPDAAGKSTVSSLFLDTLLAAGAKATKLSFPGKTPGRIGELVYRVHHHPEEFHLNSITPASLQALHIAAHLDLIETLIVPKLQNGECVILDRFWWSTWVYGVVAGADQLILDSLIDAERKAWGEWRPSALFYLTCHVPLRPEPIENWNRLKAAYDTLIRREDTKYPIHLVPNDGPIETTMHVISTKLKSTFSSFI